MAVLLNCQSISKTYGTRLLFENLTFGMNEGECLGIIGPNGSGKSTLLKIIAGVEQPDSGTINMKRALRLGFVPQEDVFEAGLSAEQILAAELENEHLEPEARANRIDAVLSRIGFAPDWKTASVETLSGGWRKRVAIARQLVREPDLLLMDEPTNHLDLDGILWLEKLLANAPFACLMVSHDRFFLESAANRIFELNRCYPEGFFSSAGRYSDFLQKRDEFLSGQLQAQKALESKVRREVEWLRRGPPARTTKSRARIDEAGRLIDELAATKSRNNSGGKVKIDFNATERQANKLLVMKGVEKTLGERQLISGLNLTLSPGMKLGLLGRNGSGKTTFLRLLTGELAPDAGSIERAERLRVVCFDQNREQLDKDAPLRRALAPSGDTVTFRDQPMHVAAWARRFLFQAEQLDMPVKSLSGGEQARILIARLMLRPADLLLLDEPTNDLDIPSLEVLEESLAEFPGALVLVTHDRYMLKRLSSEILGFDGQGGVHLFSDYSQWENAQDEAQEREAEARKSAAKKAVPPTPAPAKAASKRLTYKEQREWDAMETNILETEALVASISKELEDPDVAGDSRRLQERCAALAEAQARVDALYARWQELEEKQK
ncbi:MAG TPA: ABC-F family ATP-binding cassette domain-containing protein [Planctomycetota bacterium]|nr:ABC-F family ATP-binding cassette domain-containing protein [Planctomycetota bacterium]